MDKPAATLSQLPLFPLNNVLFPDGPLPLQIFEPRYLDMIARRFKSREPFGVVCLSEGREVRTPGEGGFAKEALHPVGTLARIDELAQPQPALMVIACTGLERFRVLRSEQQKFGLWVADVELLPADTPVAVPVDLMFLKENLARLFEKMEREVAASGGELSMRVPPRWNDCGWLANRWCELVPMGVRQKQQLLALESPVLRLELVSDLLKQMGLLT